MSLKKIKTLYMKYREVISYLFFGVVTTVINIVLFWFLTDISHIDYKVSNVIAWIVAVIVAFITNKLFVFESRGKSKEETTKELISFFAARIFSLIVDMIIMIVMVDVMNIDNIIAKIVSNVVVIVLNYIFSKLFIFNK